MRILSALLLCFLASNAHAFYYSMPFSTEFGNPFGLLVKTFVGTPAQEVKLSLTMTTNRNPVLYHALKKDICSNYGFDRTASNTFLSTGEDVNYKYGNDTFSLVPGQSTANVPLAIRDPGMCGGGDAELSLARTASGPSYIRDLLATQDTRLATLIYKDVPDLYSGKAIIGTFTVGDNPASSCADWETMSSFSDWSQYYNDWLITVDLISVGRYAKKRAGAVVFSTFEHLIQIPDPLYSNVMRELKEQNGRVPCDVDAIINIQLQDVWIVLRPDQYVDQTTKDKRGYCDTWLRNYSDVPHIQLPVSVLKGKCLQYDFRYGNVRLGLYTGK